MTHDRIVRTRLSICGIVLPAWRHIRILSVFAGTVGGTMPRTMKPLHLAISVNCTWALLYYEELLTGSMWQAPLAARTARKISVISDILVARIAAGRLRLLCQDVFQVVLSKSASLR